MGRHGGAVPSGGELLDPHAARLLMGDWFAPGGLGRHALTDIVEAARGPMLADAREGRARLMGHVGDALGDGRLRAFRVKHDVTPGGAQPAPAPAPPAPSPVEKKTWVEIALFDDDAPPKCVPFAKYKVELPDGSVREGSLDDKGKARFTAIDPGSCKVSFPAIHGDDWKLG